MKHLLNQYIKWIALLILTVTVSCNKLIDAEMPVGSSDTNVIFSTEEGAKTAVRGMYSFFSSRSLLPNTVLAINMGLYSDEFEKSSYTDLQKQYLENQVMPSMPLEGFWDNPYQVIYQANNVIERVGLSKGIPAHKKPSLIAEGKFMRAMMYFHLVNLFGDVPLLTTADYTKNIHASRSGVDKVYALILEDLIYAKNNLGDDYLDPSLRNQATSYAASALLAKVYLYLNRYGEAEMEAASVIKSGLYTLEPLSSVFHKGSRESIFCLGNWLGLPMNENTNISGSDGSNSSMRLTGHILSLFEANDLRRAVWTRNGTGAGLGTVAPLKNKIFSPLDAAGKVEQRQLIRYAEVLLIRAEARNELNQTDLAIADLDLVRQRAGITLIATTNPRISKNDLRELIFKERATELFAEGGNRWYDLKRRGEAYLVDYMKSIKPDFNRDAILLPIPRIEIDKNPNLNQNTGYN